jgi:hypothetical protein
MKAKDVRILPPELRELAKLALSFKNKYRNDSDIAVVRMILALYEAISIEAQLHRSRRLERPRELRLHLSVPELRCYGTP